MNVREFCRKTATLCAIGVGAAAIALGGPATPVAGACYNNGCGGQQNNWEWQWRCDSPAGGCGYVESFKWNWVWHCVNGVWNLDPPGRYNGYGYNEGYYDNNGIWISVVGVG